MGIYLPHPLMMYYIWTPNKQDKRNTKISKQRWHILKVLIMLIWHIYVWPAFPLTCPCASYSSSEHSYVKERTHKNETLATTM
jgi:hypothetical protein